MTMHIVIPDLQIRPGIKLDYVKWIGKYIADHAPDRVICLGDAADMESLSSYDKGKKSFEGRRYQKDIDAANAGIHLLTTEIDKATKPIPRLFLLGNHENRITRVGEIQPELSDKVTIKDLHFDSYGWKIAPFLHVVCIDGVSYCHYFTYKGSIITSTTNLLNKKHQTCIAGHQQGRQVSYATRADGKQITAIIAGSAYPHKFNYLGPQDNQHWRGIIRLNEVKNGEFDEMWISLNYLKKRYNK